MTSVRRLPALVAAVTVLSTTGSLAAAPATAAVPAGVAVEHCEEAFAGYMEPPSTEPLAACQWNMALICADSETWQHSMGAGVRIGVIVLGVVLSYPDVVPVLVVAAFMLLIRTVD